MRRRVPTDPDPVSGPELDSEPKPDSDCSELTQPEPDSDCALGQTISHWPLSAFSSVPGPQDSGGGDDGGDGDRGGITIANVEIVAIIEALSVSFMVIAPVSS